jgi:hypothetical protein
MGLDQYAYAVLPHPNNTPTSIWWHTEQGDAERTELENKGIAVVTKIAQWRKHPNLQGWMQNLWITKATAAGEPPLPKEDGWFAGEVVFNCQPVLVTFQDLSDLESAVNGEVLPETEGFFFGQSQPEDKLDDLAFIAKAREAIGSDMTIYYDSWW